MAATTTYTVKTIEVGTGSIDLAPLAGREYSTAYTALPNANLPRNLRVDLDQVFTAITGEELPLEENTFLIKAEDGVYSRLFGPVLKAGAEDVEGTEPDKLYIQWGPRFIPVSLEKGGLKTPTVTLDAEFADYNFSGRGNDHALMVSFENEDGTGQTVLPLAVRFVDWQNPPEIKALNALLKKKPEDIFPLIQPAMPKGTGSRVKADSEIDFRDLEEGQSYTVTSYRPVSTQYGQSYRMVLSGHPTEGLTAECWAHSSLRPILSTQPEITEEKPAVLTIREKSLTADGKVRIRCSLIITRSETLQEGDLDLDF